MDPTGPPRQWTCSQEGERPGHGSRNNHRLRLVLHCGYLQVLKAGCGSGSTGAGLDGLDLHGPHDLRHTFATWLEDAGVPVRVIDELMGHRAARAGVGEARGSTIGVAYRHLTPEMQARVLAAVDECLAVAFKALAAPMRPQAEDTGSAGDEEMTAQ